MQEIRQPPPSSIELSLSWLKKNIDDYDKNKSMFSLVPSEPSKKLKEILSDLEKKRIDEAEPLSSHLIAKIKHIVDEALSNSKRLDETLKRVLMNMQIDINNLPTILQTAIKSCSILAFYWLSYKQRKVAYLDTENKMHIADSDTISLEKPITFSYCLDLKDVAQQFFSNPTVKPTIVKFNNDGTQLLFVAEEINEKSADARTIALMRWNFTKNEKQPELIMQENIERGIAIESIFIFLNGDIAINYKNSALRIAEQTFISSSNGEKNKYQSQILFSQHTKNTVVLKRSPSDSSISIEEEANDTIDYSLTKAGFDSESSDTLFDIVPDQNNQDIFTISSKKIWKFSTFFTKYCCCFSAEDGDIFLLSSFSSSAKYLAIAAYNEATQKNAILILDPRNLHCVRKTYIPSSCLQLAFTASDNRLFVATENDTLQIFDTSYLNVMEKNEKKLQMEALSDQADKEKSVDCFLSKLETKELAVEDLVSVAITEEKPIVKLALGMYFYKKALLKVNGEYREAIEYYTSAITTNLTPQRSLVTLFKSTKKSWINDTAFQQLTLLATQPVYHVLAIEELAFCYQTGRGVAVNIDAANQILMEGIQYYSDKANPQENSPKKQSLPENPSEKKEALEKAASLMYALAKLFENQGNKVLAAHWYYRSALMLKDFTNVYKPALETLNMLVQAENTTEINKEKEITADITKEEKCPAFLYLALLKEPEKEKEEEINRQFEYYSERLKNTSHSVLIPLKNILDSTSLMPKEKIIHMRVYIANLSPLDKQADMTLFNCINGSESPETAMLPPTFLK